MSDSLGYIIAAIITAASGAIGWFWKNKEGPTMKQRWQRRRRVRKTIHALPDLEAEIRAFAKHLSSQLDTIQVTIATNTRKIAAATSFAAGAFEASPVAQCLINEAGEVEDCNTALLDLMHAQKHELLGMQWKQFLSGEHVKRWMDEHKWMVKDARGRQGQSKVRSATGEWIRLRYNIVPRFEVDDPVKIFHVFLWELPPKENGTGFEKSDWGGL